MKTRPKSVLAVLAAGLALGCAADTDLGASNSVAARVRLDFFFSPGCDECREVEQTVLPELALMYGDQLEIRRRDLNQRGNHLLLAEFQERLGVTANDRVSFVVNERVYVGGLDAIRAQLATKVEQALLDEPDLEPADLNAQPANGSAAERMFRSWTIGMIAAAGLADGFNPCAFATLLFFVSLLIARGQKRRALLSVGIGFCTAMFITYFLLGLGVFRALRAMQGFRTLGLALRWGMALVLVVMAVLSARDAIVFRRTGQASAIALQMPERVKTIIRQMMRMQLGARRLSLAGAATGAAVTLLESVCTGQLYVPTLAYMAGQAGTGGRALALLALYNLMFVVPPIVVFAAAYRGLTNERILAWSRANVFASKLLLAAIFAALAALMAVG